MTKIPNTQGEHPGWRGEKLHRQGNVLLLIYKDGEIRGQVECQSDEELEAWIRFLETQNQ